MVKRRHHSLKPGTWRSPGKLLLGLLLPLTFALPAYAQEIPKGVNYRRASDSVNAAAQSALEAALRSPGIPNQFMVDVVVCGPMLWKSLQPSAAKVLLDAKPLTIMLQNPEPITAIGKRILNQPERDAFWPLLMKKFPGLKNGKVRKANADEIAFYWAEIPFDIDEPFFVVEAESERFIVNISMRTGNPLLFWIDRVGDFRTLK